MLILSDHLDRLKSYLIMIIFLPNLPNQFRSEFFSFMLIRWTVVVYVISPINQYVVIVLSRLSGSVWITYNSFVWITFFADNLLLYICYLHFPVMIQWWWPLSWYQQEIYISPDYLSNKNIASLYMAKCCNCYTITSSQHSM